MPYTPILATLGYILSPDGRQVMLVHRNKRPEDAHFGKYNGLGGKVHADEDILACMRREIREEADIDCVNIVLRGTVSWPGFGKQGEDWFGFIFRIESFKGTPRLENAEGTLSWVDIDQVMSLPLWEGDHYFLPLVFGKDQRQFHGVMPYRDGKPVSWNCSWMGDDATTQPGSGQQPADLLVREARRLLALGEFAKVIDHLDVHRPAEWTVVDLAGSRILRLLGQAYVRQGEPRLGKECLEQLRSVQREQRLLEPLQFAGALTDLLRCYERLGMAETAEEICQELHGLR